MYKRRLPTRRPKPRTLFRKRSNSSNINGSTDDETERKNSERGLGFVELIARYAVGITFVLLILVNKDRTGSRSTVSTTSVGGGTKSGASSSNIAPAFRNRVDLGGGNQSLATEDRSHRGSGGDVMWQSIGTALGGDEHGDTGDSYDHDDNMIDLLETSIQSRIVEAFGELFDQTTAEIEGDDIHITKRYDRLWSVYDKGGSYYDMLADTDTPQGKAFRYIVQQFSDQSQYAVADDDNDQPTLVQRYVLALLYFSTMGTAEPTDDVKPTTITATAQESAQWTRLPGDTSWTRYGSLSFLKPTAHECNWYQTIHGTQYGIKCCQKVNALTSTLSKLHGKIMGPVNQSGDECHDDQQWTVDHLFLPNVGLRGSLPEEIGYLTSLKVLDLMNNELEGTLPQSLGLLTNLRYLGLGGNRFTGTVPDTMASLTALETLYLNFNRMDGGDYLSTSICPLKKPLETHRLYSLWSDCERNKDPPSCDCCDVCCDETRKCRPVPTEGRQKDPRSDDDDAGEDDDDGEDEDGREGDGRRTGSPIRSRSKRLDQRKETREHKSKGWFDGWI